MDKVFISRNYRYPFAASSKAKLDCESIVEQNGFRNIGLPASVIHNGIIGGIRTNLSSMLARFKMPKDGIVFLQYPGKDVLKLLNLAKRRGNRVIMLIHDLNSLRINSSEETLNFLNDVDDVIVHTNKMRDIIKQRYPAKNIHVLEIFDYLGGEKSTHSHTGAFTIGFAGNLKKSSFISKLSQIPVTFKLFGKCGEKLPESDNVIYRGCFHPAELGANLDIDFGLVWDGTEVDACDGKLGEYLKYISPHKLSLYLSSGIPVIVWEQSAMADFVKQNNVGICVSSLQDLPEIFSCLTDKEYFEMKNSALKIADRLASGYYLSKALTSILK